MLNIQEASSQYLPTGFRKYMTIFTFPFEEEGVKHLTFRSKQAHLKICSPLPRGD